MRALLESILVLKRAKRFATFSSRPQNHRTVPFKCNNMYRSFLDDERSDAPQGALLFRPMATPWENRPSKRTRPERAPEHAGSIRKSGFIMVRSLEGENTPVIIGSWYQGHARLHPRRDGVRQWPCRPQSTQDPLIARALGEPWCEPKSRTNKRKSIEGRPPCGSKRMAILQNAVEMEGPEWAGLMTDKRSATARFPIASACQLPVARLAPPRDKTPS